MTVFVRGLKMFVAALLASGVGALPACGTMGGGGMKYMVDPVSEHSITAEA